MSIPHPPSFLRLLVCLVALAGTAGTEALGQHARIEGRVVDAATGDPLPGASVVVAPGTLQRGTSAGPDGRYALSDLPAGTYDIEARMVGFRIEVQQVRLEDGATAMVDFRLSEAPYDLNEVVVSATRMATPVSAVTGAVTVVNQEDIEKQSSVAEGMGEILGQAVPGLAVGTQSMSNYGQTLRGRNVVVLIDGVPQSTLRNVARDFATIDPSVVERVEVLRGATAIYGDGATGGVINIITKRPGMGETSFHTEVGVNGSLSAFGDGIGGRFEQSVSGSQGVVRYTLSGSLAETGGFYDAAGDLIPPDPHGQGGLADTRSWDVLGKLGLDFGPERVQFSFNHFNSDQSTEYTADPSVDADPEATKARALPGLKQEIPQGTRNTVLSLDYDRAQLFGSRVHAQAYYRDYYTVFRPFDRRRRNEYLSQSFIDSERLGGRLDIETPLVKQVEAALLWGADYTYENTSQPVYIMDGALFDTTNGLEFRKVGQKIWVPPLQPHSLGLFAQGSIRPVSRLRFQGGIRYERVRMHVDDFETLAGNSVFGGDLAYDPVLFNIGAVADVMPEVNVYASFAQGFSLADIGRILRAARDSFSVGNNTLPAPKVNHYEVGVRGGFDLLGFSVSGFTSRSKLGTSMRQDATGALIIDPAPERLYGFESTLDVHPNRTLDVGGTFSWTEGESYLKAEDDYFPLDGYRIQPLKLTGYVEHETLPRWTNRLQVLYSGSRDRAFDERPNPQPADQPGYGQQPIDAYTVLDLYSSLEVGRGTIKLGLKNLLNNDYFDVISQLDLVDGLAYYSAARGASFSLSYSVTY